MARTPRVVDSNVGRVVAAALAIPDVVARRVILACIADGIDDCTVNLFVDCFPLHESRHLHTLERECPEFAARCVAARRESDLRIADEVEWPRAWTDDFEHPEQSAE